MDRSGKAGVLPQDGATVATGKLGGTSVLIAEDEMFIASDIAIAVRDADGTVIGPFATLEEVRMAIEATMPAAAILDVNLLDGDIDAVLPALRVGGTRIVINTGSGRPDELAERYPDLPVFIKPTDPNELVAELSRG